MVRHFLTKSELTNTLSNLGIQLFGFLYFIIYKCLGLLPWHFDYRKLFKGNPPIEFYNYGFTPSLLGTYTNIFIGIGITIINYYYMVHFKDLMPKKVGQMVRKEQKYMQCTSFGLLAAIQLIYAFRQDTFTNAANQIQTFDDKLMKITGRKIKNGISYYLLLIVDLFLCAVVLVAKYYEMGGNPSWFQFFMTVAPSVYATLMIVQYVMYLDILLKRFIQVYYAVVKVDENGISHFKWLLRKEGHSIIEASINEASIQQEIEHVSDLLDDLDYLRMDIIWFFSPALGVTCLDMGGVAGIISYDINRYWKEKSKLTTMELFMYGLWYTSALIVLITLIAYYVMNKGLEMLTRFILKMMNKTRQKASKFEPILQTHSNDQDEQLAEDDENLLNLALDEIYP